MHRMNRQARVNTTPATVLLSCWQGGLLWGISHNRRFSNCNTSGHLSWERYATQTAWTSLLRRREKGKRIGAHIGTFSLQLPGLRNRRRCHHRAVRQHRSSHTRITLFAACMNDTLGRVDIKKEKKKNWEICQKQCVGKIYQHTDWILRKVPHKVTMVECDE